MPHIRFTDVKKSYGSFEAITDFNADVPDREFLVLLGPSGCGKSTLLRMIAGLTDISEGTLELDGQVVNDRGPRERDVAFVFQSYALYPHMTVRANIAFPLVMEHFRWYHHTPLVGTVYKRALMRKREIRERVEQIADLMDIRELLDRRPKALSGGQRQRVAVARALVREPSLYLLDEPLSNLDAKLRAQTRSEITALHRQTRKSFVYVTHDQVEAMTMGTRIIVLDHGRIQQYGPPEEIYRSPANVFVAQFIGSPPMNLLRCEVDGDAVHVTEEGRREGLAHARPPARTGSLLLGVRPEDIELRAPDPNDDGAVDATVTDVERLGSEVVLAFSLRRQEDDAAQLELDRSSMHYAKMTTDPGLAIGEPCQAVLSLARACWFDPETGARIDEDAAGSAPSDKGGRCASSQPS